MHVFVPPKHPVSQSKVHCVDHKKFAKYYIILAYRRSMDWSQVYNSGKEEEEKPCFPHSSQSHGWHAPTKSSTAWGRDHMQCSNDNACLHVHTCPWKSKSHIYGTQKPHVYCVKSTPELSEHTHSQVVAAGFVVHAGNASVIHDVITSSSSLSGSNLCASSQARSVWSKQTVICGEYWLAKLFASAVICIDLLSSSTCHWGFWLWRADSPSLRAKEKSTADRGHWHSFAVLWFSSCSLVPDVSDGLRAGWDLKSLLVVFSHILCLCNSFWLIYEKHAGCYTVVILTTTVLRVQNSLVWNDHFSRWRYFLDLFSLCC